MSIASRAASSSELRDVHETDRLSAYLGVMWQRRGYIGFVALQEIRRRQVNNVLGNLWHLLNPALSIAVYFLIFGLLLKTTRGVDNFFAFLTTGLFVYQFTQRSTISASKSIVANRGLLQAIQFPRAILPVSTTVTELLAALPSFGVMLVVVVATGESPSLRWLAFPLVLALQMVFNLGIGLFTARLTTHVRDMSQILPFIFRLLLYGSGVIFNVEAYAEGNAALEWLFRLNPMYCFLTMARWTMLGGSLDGIVVLSAVVWSVFAFFIGFWWFRRAESTYGQH